MVPQLSTENQEKVRCESPWLTVRVIEDFMCFFKYHRHLVFDVVRFHDISGVLFFKYLMFFLFNVVKPLYWGWFMALGHWVYHIKKNYVGQPIRAHVNAKIRLVNLVVG
jgi:hypothetical protein